MSQTDINQELVSKVRNIVLSKLRPNADRFDELHHIPEAFIDELRQLGLFGLNVPKVYGGLEANRRTIAAVTEVLSYGSLAVSSLIGSHLRIAGYVSNYGTADQKQKYLAKLASGVIAAHCNNERNAKAYELYSTSLHHSGGDRWVVNGQKDWVTSSREAEVFAVTTRFVGSHPLIDNNGLAIVLLERGHPGLSVGEDIPRMGVNAISLAPVLLQNVIITSEDILGHFKHDGRNIVETAKFGTYIAYSARSIGVSRDLLDRLKSFVVSRERSFVVGSLAKQNVVRNKIASLDTKIAAANSMLQQTLDNLEGNKGDSELLAAQCKIFCTDTAKEVASVVSQIFGASGYTREFGIERIVRDVASLGIIGSPNDVILEKIAPKILQQSSGSQETNVLLKFADKVVPYIPREILQRAVLGETLRITSSEIYKGVKLSFLDLTTGSPTGTFKDKLACVTLAHCLLHKIPTFCYQSSGNTAMSFAKYANHVGVKAVLFYPKKNAYKIDQTILGKNVTSIEVDGSEADLKVTLARFSKLTGIPIMPSIQNQLDGNKFRAYYLHDHFKQTGIVYDWHVQSLSSAFGPFGYYQGFEEISKVDPTFKVPKFLGVQQEAVCPYVRKFGNVPDNIPTNVPVIEPTLFRTQPTQDLYDRMNHILTKFGGRLEVLLNEDFYKYHSFAIKLLQRKNIDVTWVTLGHQPHLLEAAGVISLCAVLKSIDDGKIEPGTSLLVSITGGTRTPPAQRNKPKYEITPDVSDEALLAIAKEFHSRL